MTEKKVLNGRLNFDASGYFVPEGDYSDAYDIRITPRGLISMEGNRPFSEYYTAPDYWCACTHRDNTRRRVYAILCRDDQKHRFIYCDLDSLSITQMFENITDTGGVDIFGWDTASAFDPAKAMKGMDIIHRDFGGDMIYFIDPNKVPLKFNDVTLGGGGYGTSPTLEMFKVIKIPALIAPACYYANADPVRNINNLRKKLFMFTVRFIYSDDEKSVWSARSKVPLPLKSEDGEYYADGTKSNVIKVTVPTGIKTVKKIEIAGRVNVNSTWSDYFLIETLDKEELLIGDNVDYEYEFFNDGAYHAIDIDESNLLFDYVPDEANCMALANGNVLVFGGIKEGLNKEVDIDIDVTTGSEAPTVAPTITMTILDHTDYLTHVVFGGVPSENDTLTVTIYFYFDGGQPGAESFSYTVLLGDTLADVVTGITAAIDGSSYFTAIELGGNEVNIESTSVDTTFGFVAYTSTSGAAASAADSVSTHKWGGRYRYSIHYTNEDGKTRGVYDTQNRATTVDIPFYSETGGNAETPFVQLSINHAPPSWATKYDVVRTKELTCLRSLFYTSSACEEDSDYVYISVENLLTHAAGFPATAQIIKYDFAEGDRARIIKNMGTPAVLNSYDYEIVGVVEFTIAAVAQDCIKIKKVTGMPSFATTTRFFIEIFSPAPTTSEEGSFYYEIGERYAVIIDANGNRVHEGKTQDQVIGSGEQSAIIKIIDGDYYYKTRTLTMDAPGTTIAFPCMDSNFSDFYQSSVWSSGRPLVIDDSIMEQYYPALIRFGLPYLTGSSTNQLARFFPANQIDASASFGDILNMKSRENFIRIFQRYKIGMVPIYRQMIYDASGTQTVGLSSQVLSRPDYYIGDFGIDKYGLSLVSTDFGDYFIDDINNALVRVSNDGLTNISDTYSAKNWSNENILTGYSGFGGFHYEERLIFMAIVDDLGNVANVISFSETYKGFNSRHNFTAAENILFVDGFLWTFKGIPYVHDRDNCNYYDVQYAPSVTVYFNKGIDAKKSYVAVSTVSNRKWGCPEILTSTGQNSELWIEDFRMREDGYHAGFLRDKASPKGLLRGDPLKGNWISVKFQAGYTASPTDVLVEPTPLERDTSADSILTLVSIAYNESNLNKR